MKKSILFLSIFCAVQVQAQVKLLKATRQKTHAGMGGTFMNFRVQISYKDYMNLQVDSVFSAADSSKIPFTFTRFNPCCKCEVGFGYALSHPAKCKTCPDAELKQYNVTQGIVVYYHIKDKRSSFRVKKFRELAELKTP